MYVHAIGMYFFSIEAGHSAVKSAAGTLQADGAARQGQPASFSKIPTPLLHPGAVGKGCTSRGKQDGLHHCIEIMYTTGTM